MKYPGDDGRYNEPDSKRDARQILSGEKKLKSTVHYRPQTEDSREVCFECQFYCNPGSESGSCDKVAGLVRAEWVCDLWTLRESSNSNDPDGDGDNDAPRIAITLNIGTRA